MFCSSCGAQIPDGSTFCATCGTAQAAAPQAAAPQQPYAAPQQPYAAPQQPYAAPQQPYGAPQQPYGAPQQPYKAPKQPGQSILNNLQLHEYMKMFGMFAMAGLVLLFGILLFTGIQYGENSIAAAQMKSVNAVGAMLGSYGASYGNLAASAMGSVDTSLSTVVYTANGFCQFMDIMFGIVCVAVALAQIYFWAQFKKNNLGFLPMMNTQQAVKIYSFVNLGFAAYCVTYVLIQGICVANVLGARAYNLGFFSPWIGIVLLLTAGAVAGFSFVYYKNVGKQIQ